MGDSNQINCFVTQSVRGFSVVTSLKPGEGAEQLNTTLPPGPGDPWPACPVRIGSAGMAEARVQRSSGSFQKSAISHHIEKALRLHSSSARALPGADTCLANVSASCPCVVGNG